MPLPSKRLILLCLVAAPIILAGTWFRPFLAIGVIYLVLLLAVAALDAATLGRRAQVRLVRDAPKQVSVQVPSKVRLRVRNEGRQKVRVLVAEDLSDELELKPERLETTLEPGQEKALEYELVARRRGQFWLIASEVRLLPYPGLWERQVRIPNQSSLQSNPNIHEVDKEKILAQREKSLDQGLNRLRNMGLGSEFESLRQYCVGDDIGKVDWKASAKRGALVVKNYQAEREQSVVVALDMGRASVAEFGGMSRLDHFVNATLLLGYIALKQGDSFSVLAFGQKVEAYLPPVKGLASLGRVVDILSGLQPQMSEPDYAGALQCLAKRHRKRSLVVMMTDVIDPDASSILIAYMTQMARRHLAILVAINDVDMAALADKELLSADEAYAKAAAIDMRNCRNKAIAGMRRRGVGIIDLPASEIAPGLVRRYVELKERRAL